MTSAPALARSWLELPAGAVRDTLWVEARASDLDTDPWTVHADGLTKEPTP